ncbi:hypothetical protein NHX12_032976 [Muraenolepis orangiensis]|uniref:Claudin n=1 Tax=Muraenolepis orangiensis TaxID=630683 RepID=A0A9Q0E4N2_9TELE|nr:hypothetical protein NHX12_032976 [Muraenolepis orangiensis]
MAASMLQLIGFLLSALGLFLISSATSMNMWSLQDRSGTIVTNMYTYAGLWASCVGTSYGTTQCRPYYSILGLPALLQAVRALMIVGIVLGAIGCVTAIFALKCLKMGSMEDSVKATMTLACGIMNLLAVCFHGTLLMCVACRGMVPEEERYDGMGYKAPSQRTGYRAEGKTQHSYNASYKANSMDTRPNQRFDYV